MTKVEKKKTDEKMRDKIARKAIKVLIPITLATATFGPTATVFGREKIIQEIKKGPTVDVDDFKKWLEEGWKSAQKLFGKSAGILEMPGRITVKSVSRSDYELELSVEGFVGSFPAPNGRIIVNALSRDSISIIYSGDMALSKTDAQLFAAYAYLAAALEKAVQSEYATFYPEESVNLLYSSMGMKQADVLRKCSSGEALAGFAAFFTDSSNPLVFLGRVIGGDVESIKQAVEAYLGKGAWHEILYSNLNGSEELLEIMKRLEKRTDGTKLISDYLSFMKVRFGLDVGDIKYQWDDAKGNWRTIGDAAK